MLQVFRIEHQHTLIGPFQTNIEFTQDLARRASQSSHLKHPGQDGLPLGNIPWSYVFGCMDMETLKQWFLLGATPEENQSIVQRLRDLGFVLSEYLVECEDYIMGGSRRQLAFDAHNCRYEGLVEHRDLAELMA